MADKDFGVKRINLISDPGTPAISIGTSTITYDGGLGLNASTVAISTDISIGGKVVSNIVLSNTYSVGIGTTVLTERLNVSGNANISGIVSATGFVGSGASLTGLLLNQLGTIDQNSYQYLLVTKNSSGTISSISATPDLLVFNPVAKYLGIGTAAPGANLDVVGTGNFSSTVTAPTFQGTATTATNLTPTSNINTSGIITASSFTGNLTGTATTASGLTTTANINTSGIITASSFTGNLTGTATTASGLTTSININTSGIITATKFVGPIEGNLTGTATTATNLTPTSNINTSGIITATSFTGNLTGTAITASGLTTTANINTSGIITATKFYGDLYGNLSSTGTLFDAIEVTGISTFTNGPVLVGRATTTGTANQALQVESGAYISGNLGIGTTNPKTTLQVETYGIKTGVGTFTASVGVSTTLDSFTVSSTDFKTAEYTVHIGFGSYIQAQKILVMQDQTTAYAEEYAVMYNNSLLVSIGATISGGNCILQATPKTGVSGLTTYRFARNTLS